jgi:DNA-binding NarL/FixJ family response regulator
MGMSSPYLHHCGVIESGYTFSLDSFSLILLLNTILAITEGSQLRPGCRMRSFLLSVREADVLRMVAEGISNKAVGEALKISVRTVEAHRDRLS